MKIRQMSVLTISTDNLSRATRRWLNDAARAGRFGVRTGGGGAFMGVPENRQDLRRLPADLRHCLTFAEANDAGFLEIDPNAMPEHALPIYAGGNAPLSKTGWIGERDEVLLECPPARDRADDERIVAVAPGALSLAALRLPDPAFVEECDYAPPQGVWIGVGDAVVNLRSDEDGVLVSVHARDLETHDPLARIAVNAGELRAAGRRADNLEHAPSLANIA